MSDSILDDITFLKAAPTAQDAFEQEGLGAEEFIWLGRPKQGLLVGFWDFFMWIFGMIILGLGVTGFYQGANTVNLFSIFWIVIILIIFAGGGVAFFSLLYYINHFPLRFLLALALIGEILTWVQLGAISLYCGWFFGVLIAVGSYMIIGGHLHDSWYRQQIWYGMTEHNLFIIYPNNCSRYSLGQLNNLSIRRRAKQQGIIYFEGNNSVNYQPKTTYWLRSFAPALFYVPKVEQVYQLLQEKVAASKKIYTTHYTQ